MFAITLLKENSRTVLYICDSKEKAIKKGDELIQTLSRDSGILSCIQADFDDNNNILNGRYKIFKSWL
mgnify:CR=1 FL=1